MKDPKKLLQIAANSSVTVLIQGESGAGKEVAARYIHDHSPRRFGPFVALNCGALAQNLIESTLEGSVKGAFTGAYADQKGIVRAANGGTLFLDEIGELPLDAQSKFLRILQEKAVLPVGSSKSIPVDFRLICATNRDLKKEIAAKRFREDLFFRLNVFPIFIPPLRDFAQAVQVARQRAPAEKRTAALCAPEITRNPYQGSPLRGILVDRRERGEHRPETDERREPVGKETRHRSRMDSHQGSARIMRLEQEPRSAQAGNQPRKHHVPDTKALDVLRRESR